ncbi:immunoglobulin-like domain-containing protein, partial [Marinobacter sp.]|uniref:immunoglobulin-like domain-containing protein n=1 Tax=Marinobacter sp. TaxID=50741 RepID=UPI003A8F7FAD
MTQAIVVSLVGQAWAQARNGDRRPLEVGDRLSADEILVTEPGTRIDLDFGDNQVITLLGEQQLSAEQGQQMLEETASMPPREVREPDESEQEPSSNRAEYSPESGHGFVQVVRLGEIIEADGVTPVTVARIQEILRPLNMALDAPEFDRYEQKEHSGIDREDIGSLDTGSALSDPTIAINVFAGDGIVNAEEASTPITITGTVGGGAKPGDQITVTVNGKEYITQVNPDGKTWQVDVPGSELAKDNTVTAEIVSIEPNGQPNKAEAERAYEVDITKPVLSVSEQVSDDADSINLSVIQGSSDPADNRDLVFTASGLPEGLSIDPDTGVISGTIDKSASQFNGNGDHTVTITVTDKAGNSDTASFDWTVNNPSPVAEDDTATTLEDQTLTVDAANGVLANDSDPDGDTPLKVTDFTVNGQTFAAGSTATIAGVGQLTLNDDGSYEFIPATDYNGTVPTVGYTVTDTDGGTSNAELALSVEPVVDISLSTPAQVNEGEPITVTASVETPVQGSPLYVILDNGETITIPVGATSGSIEVDSRTDDEYVQGATDKTFEVISATGGSETINDSSFGATTKVDIVDADSTVTARLSVDKATTEEGGAGLVYTVTLEDGNGNAIIANNDVIVNTSLGDVTVVAGSTTGTLNVPVQGDDVYIDASTVTNEITGVIE